MDDSKILKDFILFVKKKIEEDIIEYKWAKMQNIKCMDNNISRSLRKYINRIFREIFYDQVDLSKIETDLFGCKIIADLVKNCENVKYLNLSNAILPEEGIELILNSLDYFDDYYTINLEGVLLSFSNLKHISSVMNNPKKKILYITNRGDKKKSKVIKQISEKFKNLSFK